jgi:hypothetical protein
VRSFSSIISSEPHTAQSNGATTKPAEPAAATKPEQEQEQPSKAQKALDKVIDHAPKKIQEAIVGRDATTDEQQHSASNGVVVAEDSSAVANPKAEKGNGRPVSAVPSAAPSTVPTEKKGGIWGSIRRHISLRK